MTSQSCSAMRSDAVVIGGGFYGCAIAIYLSKRKGLRDVVLVERDSALMTRASYNNQARVHNGYHYPRSFVTAHRSRVNFPRFVRDWPDAVYSDFTKLYAVARRNSKVNARQFRKFCREIGARLEPIDIGLRQLFNGRLIEEVFLVQEYAFDSTRLAAWASEELGEAGVNVKFAARVKRVRPEAGACLMLDVEDASGGRTEIRCRYAFNCTYSALNQIGGHFSGTAARLKHEITEMALMQMPSGLANLGVTVMDGPFFSVMPFPPRNLHTLSHVRYTPHVHWMDQHGIDPYDRLAKYDKGIRFDRMVRDAEKYLPVIADGKYVDSLFEVKTVLVKNESDDGRPILFERDEKLPGFYSVLGGKIDNIYDVLEKIEIEI